MDNYSLQDPLLHLGAFLGGGATTNDHQQQQQQQQLLHHYAQLLRLSSGLSSSVLAPGPRHQLPLLPEPQSDKSEDHSRRRNKEKTCRVIKPIPSKPPASFSSQQFKSGDTREEVSFSSSVTTLTCWQQLLQLQRRESEEALPPPPPILAQSQILQAALERPPHSSSQGPPAPPPFLKSQFSPDWFLPSQPTLTSLPLPPSLSSVFHPPPPPPPVVARRMPVVVLSREPASAPTSTQDTDGKKEEEQDEDEDEEIVVGTDETVSPSSSSAAVEKDPSSFFLRLHKGDAAEQPSEFDVAACDGPVRFKRVLNPCNAKSDLEESEDEDGSASSASEVTYQCLFCNHVFKSHYCYQKHKRRHLNPFLADFHQV